MARLDEIKDIQQVGESSGRPLTLQRPYSMTFDEKKPRETWPEVQAEVSKDDHSDPSQGAEGNAEPDSAVVVDGEDRTNFFVWLLVACSSISGLLFGVFFIQLRSSAFRLRSLTFTSCIL